MEQCQEVYTARIERAMEKLTGFQDKIRERIIAENATAAAGAAGGPVHHRDSTPRFVACEGTPGKLADSIDPGGLARWLEAFHDWMQASYLGIIPTDLQLIT